MGKCKTIPIVVVLLATHAIGCRETKPTPKSANHLSLDHGIEVGDRLPAVTLMCTDGRIRTLAAANEIQLVTFWTPDDCSSCSRHLQGLEISWQKSEIPLAQFVVTYATKARKLEVLRSHRAQSTRPLCIDTAVTLWEQYDLRHTPVTGLIEDGRVVYMHDMPLDSEEARKKFAKQVLQIVAGTK